MIDREGNKKRMLERRARGQGAGGGRSGRASSADGKSSRSGGGALESVSLPPPYVLGAPRQFKEWRTGQAASVLKVVDSTARALILCLPTGAGKSLTYMVGAALHLQQNGGGRVAILTSTKILMDQLNNDMKETGIVDIRGRANYGCDAMNPGGDLRRELGLMASYYTCDDGLCHGGVQCELRNGGCKYYDRWREARKASIVLTNYQKWFAEAERIEREDWESAGRENRGERGGLGKFDIVILDEAHEAETELCSWLGVEIKEEECKEIGLDTTCLQAADGWKQDKWSEWTDQSARLLKSRLEEESFMQRRRAARDTKQGVAMVRKMKKVMREMEKVAKMTGEWIIEREGSKKGEWKTTDSHTQNIGNRNGRIWKFDPVWATDYAERYLLQHIPRIVLSSATARLKTAELLGLKLSETELYEQDSTFPVERRPVIHVNCVQMNYRNEQDEEIKRWVVGKIDKIINARLDRKGIVHTKSYKRRNYVLTMSRWQREGVLVWHERENVRIAVERFKSSSAPKCLISPSISTGHDFAYETCEYNIIMKIPFPDTRSKVIKERCKRDPEYGAYVASQEIVQMAGRGMRAEDDMSETIILDDNMKWFVRKFSKFFPMWFLEAYYSTNILPVPPAKLNRGRRAIGAKN